MKSISWFENLWKKPSVSRHMVEAPVYTGLTSNPVSNSSEHRDVPPAHVMDFIQRHDSDIPVCNDTMVRVVGVNINNTVIAIVFITELLNDEPVAMVPIRKTTITSRTSNV
jgi:hypothetical protein